ncbi:AMP-binding protein [Microbacterium pygmaeum]|nr:AMP-binding protein [Microbacterium pygmaeum]
MTELIEQRQTPLTADDAQHYRRDGSWSGRTLRSLLTDAAQRHPERPAIVGHVTGGVRRSMTYREMDASASSAADSLASIGVAPGDAVALMLPNWVEYPVLMFACHELRAVYVGIPVSYGAMQVLPILRRSKAKVVVIPRGWRSSDHLSLIRSLRAELPHLETVIVVDDSDDGLGDELFWSALDGAPAHGVGPADPGEICYLGFTSGTTGEPKGAMHTHETLLHSIERLTSHIGADTFGDHMVQLVASPVGHHTGYVWCTLFTVFLAGTGVQVDRWEPQWGADLIRAEGITTFFGAPTFLQDMMRTDLTSKAGNPLRCIVIAGSSVPRNLPQRAAEALGAYVAPAWGMTECSITIACTPSEPDDILQTDGSVFAGSAARVVDAEDGDVATGAVGELLVKGPSLFLGYYERPDATAASFTADGWFRTGDTAVLDERGWVSLRGRSKDIVIRGGENIPVTDVETLLFDHPAILNVAIVGTPDERLGERACAVVVFHDGQADDLAGLSRYLLDRGLSKHYLPERLIVQESLPMTQSGKIQKFRLRELIAAGEI